MNHPMICVGNMEPNPVLSKARYPPSMYTVAIVKDIPTVPISLPIMS